MQSPDGITIAIHLEGTYVPQTMICFPESYTRGKMALRTAGLIGAEIVKKASNE